MLTALIWWIIFLFPDWSRGMNEEQPPANVQITRDTQRIGGPHMLHSFLNRRRVFLNQREVELRQIYGDVQPTPMNFKIGDELLDSVLGMPRYLNFGPNPIEDSCAAKTYLERELIHKQSDSKATPSRIAGMIMDNLGSPAPQVTVISGYRRSGKSVTLKKIELDIIETDPTMWTSYINIQRWLGSDNFDVTNHEAIHSEIIRQTVYDNNRDFFENILEVNPKKVLFLLDGVDQVVGASARSVATILKTFSSAGTHVVITGSPLMMELLQELQVNFNHYHLSDMNFRETRDFMRNIWAETVMSERNLRMPLDSPILIPARLNQYATTFAAMILQTPLPRTPEILNLLKPLDSRDSSSCIEYVDSRLSWFRSPFNTVNIKLKKNEIYRQLILRIYSPTDLSDNVYGALALAQVVREVEEPKTASALINVIQTDILRAEQRIQFYAPQPFNFIDIVDGELKFIHPDIRNYFAAQYTALMFNVNENVDFFFRRIVREPRYAKIAEFINSFSPYFLRTSTRFSQAGRNSHPLIFRHIQSNRFTGPPQNFDINLFSSPFICRSKYEFSAMLDNFLVQGFSDLFRRSAEELMDRNSLAKLEPYFTDTTRLLPVSHAETFGIKNTEHQLSLPDEVRLSTRLELLLIRGLTKVYHELVNIKSSLQLTLANYEHVALHLVTNSYYTNAELFHEIMAIGSRAGYQLDFHRLIYEAINADTFSSLAIVNLLGTHIFDAPAIRVNGESLLHAAARSNNVEILRYVMNTLYVPLVVDGHVDMHVLELALDSNPTSLFTPDGWWGKMWFLAEQINSAPIDRRLYQDLSNLNFDIPLRDFRTEWFKFMLGGETEITEDNYDVRTMTVRPLEAMEVERNVALMQLRPTSTWGLSPQTLALRRKFLMAKLRQYNPQVSFSEMMVHYKGRQSLDSVDRDYYRATIKTLLHWERFILTPEDRLRIFDALIDNSIDLDDFDILRDIAQHGLLTQNGQELTGNAYRRISQRLTQSRIEPIMETMSASNRLLHSSFNALPSAVSSSRAPILQAIEQLLLANRGRPRRSLASCLFNRRPRQATLKTGCLFSWNDVQQFNDAEQPRVLSKIRINSDNFLRIIMNLEQVNPARTFQLLTFVDELMRSQQGLNVITGHSTLLLRDVVQQGGFWKYQQHARSMEAIADTTQLLDKSSSTAGVSFLRSRTAVLHGATVLPLIRALIGTVDMCIQRRNDSACLQASGFLALGMAMPVSGFLAMRYAPWIIQSWAATMLELLPAAAPKFLRENTVLIGKYGLRYGPRAVSIGLAAVGVAFDLFNIVQMSKMLDMCSTNAAACSDKDKIDMAISLTFSCVSIVLTVTLLATGLSVMAGVVVGVALMAVEMLLMGINEVVYHKNKYQTTVDENFRIFFRRIVWMSPPADVQALERRADWINALADHGWKLMETGGTSIVAYAVGIGNITGENVVAGYSVIDMAIYDKRNSRNLSRVLPKVHRDRLVPVCLPKRPDSAPYDERSSVVDTAVFSCHNSFILMHKERSSRGFDDSSTILFELEYVESGIIRGNDFLNNIYLIGNSSANLTLYSSYKTTNTFVIHSQFFRGAICLTRSRAVIDVSAVPSTHAKFSWDTIHGLGLLNFDVSPGDTILVHGQRRTPPNLHFIGRTAKPDTVICDYSQSFNITPRASSISVDAGGGSELGADKLYDCKTTIVRPFTHIYGSSLTNMTYTPYVWLSMGHKNAASVVKATINPIKSKFVVTFVHQPLFYNLISVRFVRSTRTLLWRFIYSLSEVMELAVLDYSSDSARGQVDGSQNHSGNCIFIDGYNNMIVDPVIESDMGNAEVTRFNALVTVNSTDLSDVQQHYLTLAAVQPTNFAVVMKFFEPETSTAFIFGGWTNDRFLIDNSTVFFHGGNGSDVYVVKRDSPKRVWLNNEALDEAWDVLVLPDSQCQWLNASRSTDVAEFMISISSWDVDISCWENSTAVNATLTVVVGGFLCGRQFQHLLVHWNDTTRALLPANRDDGDGVMFAGFFSFLGSVSLTLTSGEESLVLNGTTEDNPVVVYRSGPSDVVLTTKFFSTSSSSFVVLKDFFSDDHLLEISLIWRNFSVFLFGEKTEMPRVLNASSIQRLAFLSEFINDQSIIQEYHVNVTEKSTSLVIEHNKSSTDLKEQQLGVLILHEAEPKDVMVVISGPSLMLWVRGSSIYVKNWCLSPLHRLYRIEFTHPRTLTPLIVRHLTHLSCAVLNSSVDAEVILELRAKLRSAQQQFELDLGDDELRLTLCLSCILVNTLTTQPMHELFGFASAVYQANFIRDNCQSLFASESLVTTSLQTVKIYLESLMRSSVTKEQPIDTIRKSLSRISDSCWKNFTASLYNQTYQDFKFIDDAFNAILPCISSSQKSTSTKSLSVRL